MNVEKAIATGCKVGRKAGSKAGQISYQGLCKCQSILVEQVYPPCHKITLLCFRFCHYTLAPTALRGAVRLKDEAVKIHQQQNWLKRFGNTMLDNAAGLIMAMLSARIVQNFVETPEFSNLWGLLASRPVVSESTYEALSFAVEFFIALTVFTLTEHYIAEYRQRRETALAD